MRVVLQVVNEAEVIIENKVYNDISRGYVLLVGIGKDDNEDNIINMVDKIVKLRVIKDSNDKTNLNLASINGEILSISQFTLYADTKQGNRPGFTFAASKDKALALYELFNLKLKEKGIIVKSGIFGSDMKIRLENDGPFTLFLEN